MPVYTFLHSFQNNPLRFVPYIYAPAINWSAMVTMLKCLRCIKLLQFGRSKKTSKLRATSLCEGNSPVNSPHKRPLARKLFPIDDVIMLSNTFPASLYSAIVLWHGMLTNWDLLTHICVTKLIIIGSDNGLSNGRHNAIIWTSAGILLTGPLERQLGEILIEIHTFSFKKIHLNISSGKWGQFCFGFNVLMFYVTVSYVGSCCVVLFVLWYWLISPMCVLVST